MRSHARAQAHARTPTMKNPIQINVLIACEERHTPTSWGVRGGRRRHTRPLRGVLLGRRCGLRLSPSPPTVAPAPRYVRRGAPCSSPIAIRCSLRSRRVAVGSPHSGRGRGYAPATVSFSATAWLDAAHPYCVGRERGTGAGRAFCPAD